MREQRSILNTTLPIVLVAAVALWPRESTADERLGVVLNHWTTAVIDHVPGTSDAALSAVWTMTPDDRAVIRDCLRLFLKFLDGADFSKAKGDVLIVAEAARSLFPVSRSEFLERAATLHADAVIFDTRPVGPLTLDPHAPHGSFGATDNWGQVVYFSTSDGEYLNATIENPNWPLARLLLDELPPGDASRAFAATWYHGVTAYLLSHGNFGQAETNLNHAIKVLPRSAEILFDLGCVAETQGMSIFQQTILDDRDPIFQGHPSVGTITDTSWTTWARVSAPRASTQQRNAQAAELFERALTVEPHLAEARVRWARLLELDKQWKSATRQVALALSDHPDSKVAFLAHLFGMRAANALNQPTNAEAHLAEALAEFPHAQSAIFAGSETALRRGDQLRAQERLLALSESGRDDSTEDPWQEYPLGPGRLPDPPLQILWRAVPVRVH